jgi:hypothetical protein
MSACNVAVRINPVVRETAALLRAVLWGNCTVRRIKVFVRPVALQVKNAALGKTLVVLKSMISVIKEFVIHVDWKDMPVVRAIIVCIIPLAARKELANTASRIDNPVLRSGSAVSLAPVARIKYVRVAEVSTKRFVLATAAGDGL